MAMFRQVLVSTSRHGLTSKYFGFELRGMGSGILCLDMINIYCNTTL